MKKIHYLGIGFGILLLAGATYLYYTQGNMNVVLFLVGIAVALIVLPFVASSIFENKSEQEMNTMFLEFSRNLAESVVTGTPISKSIVNISKRDYGVLTKHIQKLANQISLGIPLHQALEIFARDVHNPVITRAVGLISEAERAGGEIDYILDSVAKSIAEIEKLKQERKAAISTLVVQGYIIFFIFIGIMLIMQFKILPLALQITSLQGVSSDPFNPDSVYINQGDTFTPSQLGDLFLYLLLAQGFFAGFAIGKLAEGSLKAGIKHSFILMLSAFLISAGVRII